MRLRVVALTHKIHPFYCHRIRPSPTTAPPPLIPRQSHLSSTSTPQSPYTSQNVRHSASASPSSPPPLPMSPLQHHLPHPPRSTNPPPRLRRTHNLPPSTHLPRARPPLPRTTHRHRRRNNPHPHRDRPPQRNRPRANPHGPSQRSTPVVIHPQRNQEHRHDAETARANQDREAHRAGRVFPPPVLVLR